MGTGINLKSKTRKSKDFYRFSQSESSFFCIRFSLLFLYFLCNTDNELFDLSHIISVKVLTGTLRNLISFRHDGRTLSFVAVECLPHFMYFIIQSVSVLHYNPSNLSHFYNLSMRNFISPPHPSFSTEISSVFSFRIMFRYVSNSYTCSWKKEILC